MNKNNTNLIVAIVFLLGFLALWEKFVVTRYSPPPSATSKPSPAEPNKEILQEAKLEVSKSPPSAKVPAPTVAFITLRGAATEVTLESEGGKVSSWKVKEGEHWIQLLLPENHRPTSPLEMFPGLPYAIQKISDTQAQLSAVSKEGFVVKKTISLAANPPFHKVDLTVENPTSSEVVVKTEIGWGSGIDKHLADRPYSDKDTSTVLAEQSAMAFDGKVKRWTPGFIFNRTILLNQTGAFQWAGVGNNHFLAAIITPAEPVEEITVMADRENPPVVQVPIRTTLKPGEKYTESFYLYVGPKKYDELKRYGYNLDQAVDFGFFGVIAKTLLMLLKKFEAMTDNYGWAIIILTFLIQIVVFPLTIKNFKHSLRMKELQPQIKKIQDQFKSDPKRLQVETFNLYKKHGMKFMGMEGCFPVLLQIPLFFAFYSTLNVAYELRGAPWIFWIKDLAQHDPYYVLPIIMGAGMFFQQKLTAVAMDPAQARMMMFMPIIFTFMFLKLPAGLVLYWCVNSLVNIVVTETMKRRGPSPAAT